MTIHQILSAVRRRWYILLGAVVCATVMTVMLAADGGTYTTRTVVSFMRPASTSLSPANGTGDSNIIAFAAAVVQETNNGRPPARYSMDEAPYYGAGIREGVLVELTNSGNQWVSTFSTAEVEIHVVGRTFDWVHARQQELIAKVLGVSDSQQAVIGIPPRDRITASVAPLTTHIDYISASRSGQATAGAAMLAAAVIVGVWGSVTADRRISKRRPATPAARSSARPVKGTTT